MVLQRVLVACSHLAALSSYLKARRQGTTRFGQGQARAWVRAAVPTAATGLLQTSTQGSKRKGFSCAAMPRGCGRPAVMSVTKRRPSSVGYMLGLLWPAGSSCTGTTSPGPPSLALRCMATQAAAMRTMHALASMPALYVWFSRGAGQGGKAPQGPGRGASSTAGLALAAVAAACSAEASWSGRATACSSCSSRGAQQRMN
ncbi:hypothetical protein V8C86DRAFT_2531602 [Haematococcus lacustris]